MKCNIHLFVYLIFFLVAICSCTKNTIEYTDSPSSGATGEDTDNSKIQTNFNAFISIFNTKASVSPINTNRLATVYAYNGDTFITSEKYTSKTIGSLEPILYPMYLSPATYKFYAAGVNNTNVAVPLFSNGIATNLVNNLDYIWWTTANQVVAPPTTNINITFQHCCTQVVIDLNVQDGITVDSLYMMGITPTSLNNITWSLYDGKIGPTNSINNQFSSLSVNKLTSNNFVGQFTMVPLSEASIEYLKTYFEIHVNNENHTRKYTTPIPILKKQLLPGYSYIYELELELDTVKFNNVTIKDWINVDVNDKPILPTN
ncbi:MAG: fimbrillin family protein [Marinifilaceae bacterium]